jgi:hypothetical protein
LLLTDISFQSNEILDNTHQPPNAPDIQREDTRDTSGGQCVI